ncbi:MAG: AAA family ATPase [Gemmatimonadaceae bacterium]
MPSPDVLDEIDLLVRSRYGLIVLDTIEEERAAELLKHAASRLSLHLYSWTRSRGLRRGTTDSEPYLATAVDDPDVVREPAAALALAEREGAGIYHFAGLGAYLGEELVVRQLKDTVTRLAQRRGAVVVTGHSVSLPDLLRPHAAVVELPPPSFDDYRALLERVVRDHSARMQVRVELTPADRHRLLNNLAGLTLVESEKVLNRLIMLDGCLRADDIRRASDAKREAVRHDGLLEYYPAEDGMEQVAGLAGLKAWLAKRRAIVADPERAAAFGLEFPKGVLLLGVPGCGKSLCAKAVALEWGLPLLKLDPANLYDKYVGDSEKNFKRALRTAERMAPAVLWIDEIEKAFASAGGDEDGGVSRRVFGSFLSWLQERRGDVFVVATSNDIAELPPEFIRKGRFDEVFFVDLPDAAARREILAIHLRKRRQDDARFDLAALTAATERFSGAEIEQAIVSALYSAFDGRAPLTTEILLAELAATRTLADTMGERLAELRRWASARTVAAG